MTTEEFLWSELEKARFARLKAEALPRETPRLSTIRALADAALTNAANNWLKHITR